MSKCLFHINFAKGFRGGERQTLLLIQELSKRGYEQRLLTRENSELANRIEALGLKKLTLKRVSKPYVFSLSLLKEATLVHAHETQGAQFAFLGKLFFKAPFVITRRVDNPIKKNFFTKAMYKKANKVAVLSNAIAKGVKNVAHNANMRVIPSAFSKLQVDEAQSDVIRQRYSKKFLIGNIGELDNKHKGQEFLLHAVNKLSIKYPDIYLLLLGKGKDEQKYKEISKDNPNIVFEGFVNNVGEYINAFDIFVFPSLHEGLGSILLDVMQAKVPIIASNVGGIPDIVKHEKNGLLVEPKDSKAIEEAIERLYKERVYGENLALNAYGDVEDFSPSQMCHRYERVYKEILL